MKFCLLVASCLLSSQVLATSTQLEQTKTWLQQWLPKHVELGADSSSIRYYGGHHREQRVQLEQKLSENILLESSARLIRANMSWGVFNQRLSTREFSLIPRYQLTHDLALGVGLITQSATELRTSIGSFYHIPASTEWLLSARARGFYHNDRFDLALSSQRWQATHQSGNWFETGAVNSKVTINYTGFF